MTFTRRSIAKVRRKRKPKESMIKKEGKERELRKIIFCSLFNKAVEHWKVQ